jgi:hypothetical protein
VVWGLTALLVVEAVLFSAEAHPAQDLPVVVPKAIRPQETQEAAAVVICLADYPALEALVFAE